VQLLRKPCVQFIEKQGSDTATANVGIHIDSVQFRIWPEIVEVKVSDYAAVNLSDQKVCVPGLAAAIHAINQRTERVRLGDCRFHCHGVNETLVLHPHGGTSNARDFWRILRTRGSHDRIHAPTLCGPKQTVQSARSSQA